MARYIDIESVGIGKAKREVFVVPEYADGWNDAIEIFEKQPTADVMEVKHGEWIIDTSIVERTFYEVNYKILITCSICGNRHFLGTQPYRNFTREDLKEDSYRKYRYCGQCGAKMDGGKAE